MHCLRRIVVIFNCLLPVLCQTQTFRYPVQKRSGYSYSEPSTSSTASSYYSSRLSNPSYTHSYYKQGAQRNSYPYGSSVGFYGAYKQPITKSTISGPHSSPSYSSSTGFSNPKQYLGILKDREANFNKISSSKTNWTNNSGRNRVSKADAENSKFVGAENQEDDESARTLHLKRRKFHRRFGGAHRNPCSPYGRDAGSAITPPPKEQGRFLWDVNIYNVYPQSSYSQGCGGYGGFGGGLSDPIGPEYYSPGAGIANFLGLIAPGILQNPLAVTVPPPQFADYGNDFQSDPEVDPNYRPAPASVPVRRPNRVFYDSVMAPPATPSKIVGDVSTLVNGLIQQLTGNVQPVYG